MKRQCEPTAEENVFLSPFEVGFTQNSCSCKFRNGKTISQLVGNLLMRLERKRDVPKIRVCEHANKWYSLDNRRLAAFRVVEMLRPGACKRIKCQKVVADRQEWQKKFSTQSEGRVIVVTHTNGEVVGDSLATTTYRVCDTNDSDLDSSASDDEIEVEDDEIPAKGPLLTIVTWKCRVDKSWHPYPEQTNSFLESQYQACMAVIEGIGISEQFSVGNSHAYCVHFTAERQCRAHDMSCRRAVWRHVEPPPLAALTTPARAEKFLQLPMQGFKRTRAVIDAVVRALHSLSPSQVYEGGSFKKRTCLAYDFDVDLVLWLNQFNHSLMTSYKSKVKDALRDAFPPVGNVPQIWYTGETPYCLKLRVRMLSIDIVITGDPKHAVIDNPDRFYEATKSPLRDTAVVEAKEAFPRLHHLILLAKCWKKRNEWSKMGGPISYFLELLCMRAAREAGKECSLASALRTFFQLCIGGNFQIVDHLGKRIEVPQEDHQNFRRFAEEALREL